MSDPVARLNVALEGRYRIERELGEGGTATVYLAADVRHGRGVALKVLKPELAAALGAERFLAEIRTTARLQHPHILPLFDSGEADGLLYYVMPHVGGESLRDKLRRERQLGVEESLVITEQVASALEHAHRDGLVHRDVKPANVLLSGGRAVLADFGVALSTHTDRARLTSTGLSVGSPLYMSPEQISADRELDARSDQYSLACMLYEMLAGDPPFAGSNAQALMARHVLEAPRPVDLMRPDVGRGTARALERALAKAPGDRFAGVADFAAALRQKADEPVAADRRSIAVLPFANMSDDPEQEYFADGMAEEIISALTRVEGLCVIARMSAFAFKGREVDVGTIGRELGVATVVEGSVRRLGDRLRITVQLIDVRSGRQLWSERYDRPMDDLFDVQDEIARRIVGSVTPQLLEGVGEALVERATQSQEAYDLYLRAGDCLARVSPSETRRAITMLERATVLDERFAGAWARLSGACCLMDAWFEHDARWRDRTDQALARALALDPESAEALMWRGRVLWTPRHGFSHRDALRMLNESLRAQPGGKSARLWRGLIMLHVGLMREAEAELDEVLAADPTDATVLQFIAQNMLFQLRYDAAEEYQRRALALDPGHHFAQIFQPTVLLYQDDLSGAETALNLARQLLKDDPLLDGNEALLWAKRGETERAEAAIARACAERPSVAHSHHAWHYAAAACGLLGDVDRAISLLVDAARAGFPNYVLFRNDPHLAPLRGDPRMASLLAALESEWEGYLQEFGRPGSAASWKAAGPRS